MSKLKGCLGIFGALFVCLFIIGAAAGYGERKSVVAAEVLQNLSVREQRGRYFIAHMCNGRVTHFYDVERAAVDENPDSLTAAGLLPAVFALKPHKEFVLAALGGASGGFSFASLRRTANQSGPRQVYAVVLGAISGYLVGYWVTAQSEIRCDSEQTRTFLKTADTWKGLVRDFLIFKLYELGVRQSKWQHHDPNGSLSLASLEAAEQEQWDYVPKFESEKTLALLPLWLCRTNVWKEVARLAANLNKSASLGVEEVKAVDQLNNALLKLTRSRAYSELMACITALRRPVLDYQSLAKVSSDEPCKQYGIEVDFSNRWDKWGNQFSDEADGTAFRRLTRSEEVGWTCKAISADVMRKPY